MRIFKTYFYNAANVCKFNGMFDLVENLLHNNNWSYEKLWFTFYSVSPDEVEKIIDKVPRMKDFYYSLNIRGGINYTISNFDHQWEGGNPNGALPKPERADISKVVKGIPRPLNTPFNAVIFDEIDWFGVKAKPMQRKDEGSMRGMDTSINSSHIAIQKMFDYGNKYNPLIIQIELTDVTGQGILDDSVITAVFNEFFGKCMMSSMSCVLEEHEKDDYKAKDMTAAKLTEEMQNKFWDSKNHMPLDSDLLPHHLSWDRFSDFKYNPGNAPKISPKSAILKVFKSTGYRYVKCEQGSYYTIEKIDNYNNQILLGIILAPSCRRLEADVAYSGLGFHYRMNLSEYVPDDQAGVVEFVENVYAAVKYLEQHYIPEIQKIYGMTPPWFQYVKK